jgi:hypothetical protein
MIKMTFGRSAATTTLATQDIATHSKKPQNLADIETTLFARPLRSPIYAVSPIIDR